MEKPYIPTIADAETKKEIDGVAIELGHPYVAGGTVSFTAGSC